MAARAGIMQAQSTGRDKPSGSVRELETGRDKPSGSVRELETGRDKPSGSVRELETGRDKPSGSVREFETGRDKPVPYSFTASNSSALSASTNSPSVSTRPGNRVAQRPMWLTMWASLPPMPR